MRAYLPAILVESIAVRVHGRPGIGSSLDLLATTIGNLMVTDREGDSARKTAMSLGVPYADDLRDREIAAPFLERFPISYAKQHLVAALASEEGRPLVCAIGSFDSWQQIDVVARHLGRPVEPLVASPQTVLAAINAGYEQRSSDSYLLVQSMDVREALDSLSESNTQEDLLDSAGRPPVSRLVNSVLFEAAQARASDVHFQPEEESLVVRQRIDGILFDCLTIPKDYQDEVLSRIKVIGKMNIAEKRLPQDGRATVQLGDRLIDLRLASLPTRYGERIVIRFLDKSAALYRLDQLGMEDQALRRFRRIIRAEHGLILATGPTGGGKTTTLYSALQEIHSKDVNVLTLEDPIEYQLAGISQTQVNPKKGLTFASGLRNVLRQDPDIIMVGEIRDQETAVMAIQSALTGHLVFSTLHTNDASSAIARLLDLGIEPYLIASSLIGVVAQRLVRRICPSCRVPRESADGATHVGGGCADCRQTGYQGRIGVYELLEVDEGVRQLIQQRAAAAEIRKVAVAAGMTLLHEDGQRKARAGMTTAEEVLRVTMND